MMEGAKAAGIDMANPPSDDGWYETEEGIKGKRDQLNGMINNFRDMNRPIWDKVLPQVDITDFDLKVSDGHVNKVYVIRPKSLSKDEKHACYLWAHGGGAIVSSAVDNN